MASCGRRQCSWLWTSQMKSTVARGQCWISLSAVTMTAITMHTGLQQCCGGAALCCAVLNMPSQCYYWCLCYDTSFNNAVTMLWQLYYNKTSTMLCWERILWKENFRCFSGKLVLQFEVLVLKVFDLKLVRTICFDIESLLWLVLQMEHSRMYHVQCLTCHPPTLHLHKLTASPSGGSSTHSMQHSCMYRYGAHVLIMADPKVYKFKNQCR